jgi:hypothetical protein
MGIAALHPSYGTATDCVGWVERSDAHHSWSDRQHQQLGYPGGHDALKIA